MYQTSRHSKLLEILKSNNICSIAELAREFGVSEETVRRDVRQLETTGQVWKMHGGVKLARSELEATYQLRVAENARLKRRIGQKAAQLVTDGMTVFIDSGTTSYWLAKSLDEVRHLTVITNAIEVARELTGRNQSRVYFAGGELNEDYRSCFGLETQSFLQKFSPEVAFFSIGAIDSKRGMLDFHLPEAELKRAIAPLARKVMVLADSTKFTRNGLIHVLNFADIDILVTDEAPDADTAAALDGVEVIIAGA